MISTQSVALPHGIKLTCHQAGSVGQPRVLLLHGFPEAGFIWQPVQQRLVGRAQLWAPNLRGFADSSAPPEAAAYRPRALVADVVALIEAMGGPLDLLVAHDWGGALAWNLAAQRPDLLKRLLIINSPHPGVFLHALKHDPAQQAASAYMNRLCEPGMPARLAAHDYRGLWDFFEGMSPSCSDWLTPALRQQYRAVWAQSLETSLNWYRASPLKPPSSEQDAIWRVELSDEAVTVRCPTRVVWGEADAALPVGLLQGLERFVPQLSLRRVLGASHWIIHEQPELIVAEIAALLDLAG